jgi:hypothetical protein
MSDTVARLRAAVRESRTPLAAWLDDDRAAEPDEPERALLAAGGPRAAAHRDDVEVAVAAVEEGYRLHYGRSRALRIDDGDLALLAGDRMYALGLARLAAIGDMTAITELADVISLGAKAHADGDARLADAAWQAGVAAIGWGPGPRTAEAKALARAGDPGAADALRVAARSTMDD